MRQLISIFIIVFCLAILGCETVVTYDLPINQTKIVVEGSIENDSPPLVFLSISFPFFGDVNFNDIESLLIKGADISVSDGIRTVDLLEYGKDELLALSAEDFEMLAPIIEQIIGFEIDQSTIVEFYDIIPNFSFYTVKTGDFDFVGEIGKAYDLSIQLIDDATFGTTQLTASTIIPNPVALDSLWIDDHPNTEIDTLFQIKGRLQDPDSLGNFYRYFSRSNGGPWLTNSSSVFDDAFINGTSLPFPISQGQTEREKLEEPDFDIDGYWEIGDTAEIKFCMINEDHYQFWRTVENEKSNLGSPFGSFSIIKSNIVGDRSVGIWGGYAATYSTIIVPEL